MKLIEKQIIGKKDPETCEDGIVVTKHYIAVIDGSTSKSRRQINDRMRNGKLAMSLIADYIGQIPNDWSCEEFCHGMTRVLHSFYLTHEIDIKHLENYSEERLTASAIIYSNARKEVWMIGDCQCYIGGIYYENGKPSEAIIAEKRAAYIQRRLSEGMGIEDFQVDDSGRQQILPDLIEGMKEQNKTYAVIDGFPIYMSGVKVIPCQSTATNQPLEIVLASDGYPFLCQTLAESEEKLQKQLTEDPLNIHTFKATKGQMRGNLSFDDRAYIRFQV